MTRPIIHWTPTRRLNGIYEPCGETGTSSWKPRHVTCAACKADYRRSKKVGGDWRLVQRRRRRQMRAIRGWRPGR